MPAYLCVSVGADPESALPILATADPDVVQGAVRAILGKVTSPVESPLIGPARGRTTARRRGSI